VKQLKPLHCSFLRHGLSLITKNYRCQYSEIDLIMKDGNTLVFIEVSYRQYAQFGGSAGSITAKKQKKIMNTELHFFTAPSNRCR